MMDEFIVFDNDSGYFIDERQCIFCDGTLYRNSREFEDGTSDDLTMFWGIGKTDIEGNKIYADSSVVEVYDKKSKFYEDICIVRYDKNICSYMLCSVDFEDERQEHFKPDYSNKNYKIIGTLQQDKELLNEK